VHIELQQERPDSTILTLSQTHFDMQEALTETTIRGVLYTFWALSLANLADHLEGRELTARCDFTSAEMRAQFLIDASLENVYDSLIDSDKASRWFGFPIGIEPWVGGRFAMGGLESFATRSLCRQDRRAGARPHDVGRLGRQRDRHVGARKLQRQDAAHLCAEWIHHQAATVRRLDGHAVRARRTAPLP
jgi:hypothetical protein